MVRSSEGIIRGDRDGMGRTPEGSLRGDKDGMGRTPEGSLREIELVWEEYQKGH